MGRGKKSSFVIVSAFLGITACLVLWIENFQTKVVEVVTEIDIPLKLGDWEGEEIEVDQRTYDILETPMVIIRRYQKNGKEVYFAGIFSSKKRKAIHPPEICLTGGGVAAQKKIIDLKIGEKIYPTNKLEILGGEDAPYREAVFYWYRAGDNLYTNFYAQQMYYSWTQIIRRPIKSSDVALLRISVVGERGESSESLEEKAGDFAGELFSHLGM